MRRALLTAVGAVALLTASDVLAAGAPDAKAAAKPAAVTTMANPTIRQPGWKMPRTSWGAPDLGGHWSNATLTPLTRNPRLTDKPKLSAEEARAMEATW